MKEINYEEYKKLDVSGKTDELNSFWELENKVLQGIHSSTDNNYITINNVRKLNGAKLNHPFYKDRYIDEILCWIDGGESFELSTRFKNNKGKKVIFEYNIQTKSKVGGYKDVNPIVADCKTISLLEKAINYNKVYNLDLPYISEIIEEVSLKEPNHKILLPDELFHLSSKKILDLSEEIREKNIELNNLEEKRKLYERIGFLSNEEKSGEQKVDGKSGVTDKKKQVKYIQKYLGSRSNKELYYEKHIIEKFLIGLCTDQLIILSGEPGTGKTSLAEGFAEAVSAECKIISVQPNWTDNQDLLGFYNPIEKTYVSTPFLDAIIEAESQPDKLFVICLDEMNLAHVEYYFAEFLSKLYSKDKTLNLYSDNIYNSIIAELNMKSQKFEVYWKNRSNEKREENFLENDNILDKLDEKEREEYIELKWRWKMLTDYRSNIKIPDNIRFVGTINKDETTKDLSPKVLDRSFIIDIESLTSRQKKTLSEDILEIKEEYNNKLYLKSDNYSINTQIKLAGNNKQKIDELKLQLRELNIFLNYRFDDQVEQVLGSGILKVEQDDIDKVGNYDFFVISNEGSRDEELLFDYIVSSMILPKININVESGSIEVVNIEHKLKDTTISKNKFDWMKEYWNKEEVLTFWR